MIGPTWGDATDPCLRAHLPSSARVNSRTRDDRTKVGGRGDGRAMTMICALWEWVQEAFVTLIPSDEPSSVRWSGPCTTFHAPENGSRLCQ
jgi:hypothetical protein